MGDDCSSDLRRPPGYTAVDLSLPTYEQAVGQGARGTTTIDVSKPESSDAETLATSAQTDGASWSSQRNTSEPVAQRRGPGDTRQSQKDIKCSMIALLIIILLTVGIGSQYIDK